jgi:hypothetical protein
VQLDPVAATGTGFGGHGGVRLLVTAVAVVGTALSVAIALYAARAPSRRNIIAAGLVSVSALPFALAASVLEVAPHAFEIPTHVCPFCLLKPDVLGLGYPLYGALFVAVVWATGSAASAGLARGTTAREALAAFASRRLRLGAALWVCAFALGALPIVRYAVVGGGASLFP